jgi:hypothetical protein
VPTLGMHTPLVIPSNDCSRALVLLAASPLELHVRQSPTGRLVAWWQGAGARWPVAVGEA